MKILFVWTGITSYMADCWRELQRGSGVELKIVVECVESGKEFNRERVLMGLDACVVGGAESGPRSCSSLSGRETASPFLQEWKPDVVFAVGWHSKVVRAMVAREDWRDVPKVCCFDMPWRKNLRCFAARWILGPFLRNYCAAFVSGKSAARYAKWLGFNDVTEGMYAIDIVKFQKKTTWSDASYKQRTGFLFVGRKVSAKGLDFLKKGYAAYQRTGGNWILDVPDWVDPDDVPHVMSEHACLILPSRWEPWGVVVAEAKAAGMAVIVSDRVGARHDLPVDEVVRYDDVEGLAAAMRRIETKEFALSDGGRCAIERFSCAAWCERVKKICDRVKG